MARRILNRRSFLKGLVLTESDRVCVGIDVHKHSLHVAIRLNGGLACAYVGPQQGKPLVETLLRLRPASIRVAYEAGPTGFGLARQLRRSGLDVVVAAPSRTLRSSSASPKTDRRDARTLAEHLEKHLLTAVSIPTEQESADRQVVRLRDQGMRRLRRIKQQIRSFLLFHGLPEPRGLAYWSREAVAGLRTMRIACPELRFTLDTQLEELAHAQADLKRVEKELQRIAGAERHAAVVAALRAHPGVGLITAMKVRTELFQPDRFATGKQVARYTGLDPRVHQSGDTSRGGPISRAGRGPLRAVLTEASWVWIRYDEQAYATYRRLVGNTGESRKAIVAVARRLMIRLWRILCGKPPGVLEPLAAAG